MNLLSLVRGAHSWYVKYLLACLIALAPIAARADCHDYCEAQPCGPIRCGWVYGYDYNYADVDCAVNGGYCAHGYCYQKSLPLGGSCHLCTEGGDEFAFCLQ